jgi:hypothetical protein
METIWIVFEKILKIHTLKISVNIDVTLILYSFTV